MIATGLGLDQRDAAEEKLQRYLFGEHPADVPSVAGGGRKTKPPRLWLRPDELTWIILHNGRQHRTGLRVIKVDKAQKALDDYCALCRQSERPPLPIQLRRYGRIERDACISFRRRRQGNFQLRSAIPQARLKNVLRAFRRHHLSNWKSSRRCRRKGILEGLHSRFARERMAGEWFRRSARLSRFIAKVGMTDQS